uniref:Uncharacterized protein LOC104229005 n=1 Tax=Nicotiana sylvestris TaxID=4096 RepID=A0A1U7WMR6_NICSY
AFTNLSRVTKSHITAVNAPIRVDVPTEQYDNANESRPLLKRGRPIGSNDKNPRKRKGENDQNDHNMEAIAQEEHKDIIIDKTSQELQKSLYGLKQSWRIWYNRLSEYLLKDGYKNDPICPCIFIKRSVFEFVIIAVYVDDLNIIGTSKELPKVVECFKREFEMKDLDPFRPQENDEDLVGDETPYLSGIGALMYLANNTRPNIAFAISLLARFSSSLTRTHWNGYLSDSHKARSQTGYLFTYGDNPTTLYEDNVSCIAQLKGGYIKGDRTKHISPKFFFTHDL